MLRPDHRLRNAADLNRLRRRGEVWRHPLAILLVDKNDLNVSRIAFMASRRVGNAVTRNRAKRLLREVVRRHLDEIETGWDLLFVARRKTPEAPYRAVEAAVLRLLRRAKLLDDEVEPKQF